MFHHTTLLLFLMLSVIENSLAADTPTSTPTSTPLSTPSVTNSNSNSTSSSPLISAATSTARPATTSLPKVSLRSPFCFCDQFMNKCEINCCCDLDCTPKDKKIFSSCTDYDLITGLGVTTKAKEKACHRQEYIYSNNTPFHLQRKSSNMFCIVSDNFKKEPVYDVPIGKFKSKFVKPGFRWTSLAALNVQKLKTSTTGYKYGSLILSAQQIESQNDTEFQVQYFELPSNMHGKSCLGHEPLKFLQNSDTTCEYEMTDNNDDLASNCESIDNFNANYYFNPNTTIVGRIDLKSNDDDKLVHFNFTICKDEKLNNDNGNCLVIDGNKIPVPKYDHSRKQCINVMKNVQMTFVHEGTIGILAVFVQLHFVNVSFGSSNAAKLQQHFKVRFLWKDEFQALTTTTLNLTTNLQIPDLPKSGNPGYAIGKAVIVGTLITHEDIKSKSTVNETLIMLQDTGTDDKEPLGVALLHDEGYYLDIINFGVCQRQQQNRRPILFAMNIESGCELPISQYKYCEELKADLGLILFGTRPTNFSRRAVASFGNPFILNSLSDWIPITILNNPFLSVPNSVSLISNGCSNGIITSVHIQIIYAHVGPVVFPHKQIRGIIYEFGEPLGNLKSSSSPSSSSSLIKLLSLSTTVEFIDITSIPTHKIAQWPTISIQLPSDFFYPFSSSKSSSFCGTNIMIVTLIQILGIWIYSM